jgi:hypothetical protein
MNDHMAGWLRTDEDKINAQIPTHTFFLNIRNVPQNDNVISY